MFPSKILKKKALYLHHVKEVVARVVGGGGRVDGGEEAVGVEDGRDGPGRVLNWAAAAHSAWGGSINVFVKLSVILILRLKCIVLKKNKTLSYLVYYLASNHQKLLVFIRRDAKIKKKLYQNFKSILWRSLIKFSVSVLNFYQKFWSNFSQKYIAINFKIFQEKKCNFFSQNLILKIVISTQFQPSPSPRARMLAMCFVFHW